MTTNPPGLAHDDPVDPPASGSPLSGNVSEQYGSAEDRWMSIREAREYVESREAAIRADERKKFMKEGPWYRSLVHGCCVELQHIRANSK